MALHRKERGAPVQSLTVSARQNLATSTERRGQCARETALYSYTAGAIHMVVPPRLHVCTSGNTKLTMQSARDTSNGNKNPAEKHPPQPDLEEQIQLRRHRGCVCTELLGTGTGAEGTRTNIRDENCCLGPPQSSSNTTPSPTHAACTSAGAPCGKMCSPTRHL